MLARLVIFPALLVAAMTAGAAANDPPEPARFEPRSAAEPARPLPATPADTLPARPWSGPPADPSEAETHERPASLTAPLPAGASQTLRLPAPGTDEERSGGGGSLATVLSVLASLAMVLGLFLIVAWLLRRGLPQTAKPLPREAVEVLGRTPLAPRQYATLLRVGNKLLLVSLTPSGAETLTEISDPGEVDRLSGICAASHPHSATNAFRQVFQQFTRQPGESQARGEDHAA